MAKPDDHQNAYLAGYYKASLMFDIVAAAIGLVMSGGLLLLYPLLFVQTRTFFSAGLLVTLSSLIVSSMAFQAAIMGNKSKLSRLLVFLNWSVVIFYGLGYWSLR